MFALKPVSADSIRCKGGAEKAKFILGIASTRNAKPHEDAGSA
jgi:hypothetical protein